MPSRRIRIRISSKFQHKASQRVVDITIQLQIDVTIDGAGSAQPNHILDRSFWGIYVSAPSLRILPPGASCISIDPSAFNV